MGFGVGTRVGTAVAVGAGTCDGVSVGTGVGIEVAVGRDAGGGASTGPGAGMGTALGGCSGTAKVNAWPPKFDRQAYLCSASGPERLPPQG